MKKLFALVFCLFSCLAHAQSIYLECKIKEVLTGIKGVAGQSTEQTTLNIIIENGYIDITTDGLFSLYAPVNSESARFTAKNNQHPDTKIKIKMNVEINRLTGNFFGTAISDHPNGNSNHTTGTGVCNKISSSKKF